MALSFRTKYTENKYQKFLNDNTKNKECIFCRKDLLIREFDNWILLQNRYPYDWFFKIHHMLAPKRHVAKKKELTAKERKEYDKIIEELGGWYDCFWYNFRHRQTISNHLHYHLLVWR